MSDNVRLIAMVKYPIFLKLNGRRVIIIGGGVVAARKVQALAESDASLTVVAEHINDDLIELCQSTQTKVIKSSYSKNYLSGALLAIAATDDNELNKQIYKDCQELGILCNVVDVPQLCDFFVPAVVKCGDLQIAVSTNGNCPAYARHIREKLETLFTNKHGEFLIELEKVRKQIISQVSPSKRKGLLTELVDDKSFECFVDKGCKAWRAYAAELISDKK